MPFQVGLLVVQLIPSNRKTRKIRVLHSFILHCRILQMYMTEGKIEVNTHADITSIQSPTPSLVHRLWMSSPQLQTSQIPVAVVYALKVNNYKDIYFRGTREMEEIQNLQNDICYSLVIINFQYSKCQLPVIRKDHTI